MSANVAGPSISVAPATEAGAPHVEALRGQIECDWELGRRTNRRDALGIRRYGLSNAHMRALVETWNDPTLRLREPLPINPRDYDESPGEVLTKLTVTGTINFTLPDGAIGRRIAIVADTNVRVATVRIPEAAPGQPSSLSFTHEGQRAVIERAGDGDRVVERGLAGAVTADVGYLGIRAGDMVARDADGNIVRVTASPASIAAAQRGTARVVAISDHAITLSNGVTSHGAGIYSAPLRFTAVGQRVTLTYDHASQQWRGSGAAPSRPANNGRTKRQERAHAKRRRRGRT